MLSPCPRAKRISVPTGVIEIILLGEAQAVIGNISIIITIGKKSFDLFKKIPLSHIRQQKKEPKGSLNKFTQ